MRAILTALAILVYSPALAAPTCIVVVPTDQVGGNSSPRVVERHEKAHCNGWEGEEINPPLRFQGKPRMKVETMRVPTRVAEVICKGRIGCQWFE